MKKNDYTTCIFGILFCSLGTAGIGYYLLNSTTNNDVWLYLGILSLLLGICLMSGFYVDSNNNEDEAKDDVLETEKIVDENNIQEEKNELEETNEVVTQQETVDYNSYTKAQLIELCKEKNITGISKLTKAELIEKLK